MCEFAPGDKVVTPSEGHNIGVVRKIFLEIEFPDTKRNIWGLMQPKHKTLVAEPFVYKSDGSCKAVKEVNGKTVLCDYSLGHPTKHHATVDDIEVTWGIGATFGTTTS